MSELTLASPMSRPRVRVQRAHRIAPWLYILPATAAFVVWVYEPLLRAFELSFYSWNIKFSKSNIICYCYSSIWNNIFMDWLPCSSRSAFSSNRNANMCYRNSIIYFIYCTCRCHLLLANNCNWNKYNNCIHWPLHSLRKWNFLFESKKHSW